MQHFKRNAISICFELSLETQTAITPLVFFSQLKKNYVRAGKTQYKNFIYFELFDGIRDKLNNEFIKSEPLTILKFSFRAKLV